MKAWVLHKINDILFEEVKQPQIREDEVLVSVKAAGICGSDIPRIYQTGAHTHPLIPGHEFSGQVVEIGNHVDPKWLHKRVGIFPLIPCKNCISCQKEHYELCRNYNYLGSRQDCGFAEFVAVPEWNLIALPDNVSFEAAAMMEPMAVAVHAMRRVKPQINETVVVCGLGTIGMFLVMVLIDAGVKNILVVGKKEFQKQTVLQLGLDSSCYCDSRTQNVEEWVLENTKRLGTDVFFECVGRNEVFSQAVNLTAPQGRICLVGNPYSDMMLEKPVYWKMLRNQLTLTGTWNSSFTHQTEDDWHYVLDKLDQKKIQPEKLISHRFDLENAIQGMQIMKEKTQDYIKVMIHN